MQTIIKNGLVLFSTETGFETRKATIYIDKSDIVGIDELPAGFEADKVIDATDMLVMPGLINMHAHQYMCLFRNVANDVPLSTWLFDNMFPREAKLTPEDIYWGQMLANVESIRTGTTCYNDFYLRYDSAFKACEDIGIRAYLAKGMADIDSLDGGDVTLADSREHIERWLGKSELVTPVVAPHATYTCSAEFFKKAKALADEFGLLYHTHIAETDEETKTILMQTGFSPVQWLDTLGVLDDRTIAAHCIKISQADSDLLARRGVSVVTNPASNLKLGNGIAPVPMLLDSGVNVCLGTDGPASNNTVNMFREMMLEALIQKGINQETTCMPAVEVLKMAIERAAYALHRENDLGKIAVGYKADIAILNLKCPQLQPMNDVVSSLVYSANGSEVNTVLVNGNVVMENRKFVEIDEEQVYAEAAWRAERLNQM